MKWFPPIIESLGHRGFEDQDITGRAERRLGGISESAEVDKPAIGRGFMGIRERCIATVNRWGFQTVCCKCARVGDRQTVAESMKAIRYGNFPSCFTDGTSPAAFTKSGLTEMLLLSPLLAVFHAAKLF